MSQKGFTLIEVLVVMAVGSMVMAGIVLTIPQVVWGTIRTNSQVVALADINHAAWQIKKDLLMTQYTTLTDGVPQGSVTLSWIDYTSFVPEDSRSHSSAYALSGTELQRTHDGIASIVGRNITSISFTKNDRVVNVVITAAISGVPHQSETLKFSMYLRSEEVQ